MVGTQGSHEAPDIKLEPTSFGVAIREKCLILCGCALVWVLPVERLPDFGGQFWKLCGAAPGKATELMVGRLGVKSKRQLSHRPRSSMPGGGGAAGTRVGCRRQTARCRR